MLYVGIGNVKTLPELSHFTYTSRSALFIILISFSSSPYFFL